MGIWISIDDTVHRCSKARNQSSRRFFRCSFAVLSSRKLFSKPERDLFSVLILRCIPSASSQTFSENLPAMFPPSRTSSGSPTSLRQHTFPTTLLSDGYRRISRALMRSLIPRTSLPLRDEEGKGLIVSREISEQEMETLTFFFFLPRLMRLNVDVHAFIARCKSRPLQHV